MTTIRAMPRLRRVILESPYADNGTATVEQHTRYARDCLRDSLDRGEAPLASHLLYTQPGVLSDDIPIERNLGIMAGLSWISKADAVVFYTDVGFSPGMKQALKAAIEAHIPLEYRKIWPPIGEAEPSDHNDEPAYSRTGDDL